MPLDENELLLRMMQHQIIIGDKVVVAEHSNDQGLKVQGGTGRVKMKHCLKSRTQ